MARARSQVERETRSGAAAERLAAARSRKDSYAGLHERRTTLRPQDMMPRLMIGVEGLDDDLHSFGGKPVVAFLFDRTGELLGGEVVHWPSHPEAIKRTHA